MNRHDSNDRAPGRWETASSYREPIANAAEARALERAAEFFRKEDAIREKMAAAYKKAQEDPENAEHWRTLGDLAVEVKEVDYAIVCYEYALALVNGVDAGLKDLLATIKARKPPPDRGEEGD